MFARFVFYFMIYADCKRKRAQPGVCFVFDVFFLFLFSFFSTLTLALVIFHYFHRRSKLSDFNDEIYWRIYLYMILEQSWNWNWNCSNCIANWCCSPFNRGRLGGRETNKYVRHVTDFVGKINDLTNMSERHCTVVAQLGGLRAQQRLRLQRLRLLRLH